MNPAVQKVNHNLRHSRDLISSFANHMLSDWLTKICDYFNFGTKCQQTPRTAQYELVNQFTISLVNKAIDQKNEEI